MAKAENPKIKSLPSIEVKLTTENVKEEHINAVKVEWFEDHSDWKHEVDTWQDKETRVMPDDKLRVTVEKSDDNSKNVWKTQWPEPSSNLKEVYGVLRAEYYFGKKLTIKKIASKVGGNRGIDSLFYDSKAHIFYIVESKCTADIESYKKYKNTVKEEFKEKIRKRKNAIEISTKPSTKKKKGSSNINKTLGKTKFHHPPLHLKQSFEDKIYKILKTVYGDDVNESKPSTNNNNTLPVDNEKSPVLKITQMTWRWVFRKCEEMIGYGNTEDVKINGEKLTAALKKKANHIQRWYNLYGTNPFYRLPGKYKITGAVSAEFVETEDKLKNIKIKEFGWPDQKGTMLEFLCLDDYKPFLLKEIKQEKKANHNLVKNR